jgi:hypothetical protein
MTDYGQCLDAWESILHVRVRPLPHPGAPPRATQKAAVRRLKPIADFVHTITFDNGKEFATHRDITHALKATIFFATLSCMGARFE